MVTKVCECSGCGEAFTCLSAFDQHQTWNPFRCHDPASRGLVRNAAGRWHWPASDASRANLRNLRAEQADSGVSP